MKLRIFYEILVPRHGKSRYLKILFLFLVLCEPNYMNDYKIFQTVNTKFNLKGHN